MKVENRTPTSLEDAIAAQASVVNVLADEHEKARQAAHDAATKLVVAQTELNRLRREQAEQ